MHIYTIPSRLIFFIFLCFLGFQVHAQTDSLQIPATSTDIYHSKGNYAEALKAGQDYLAKKQYPQAKKAFEEALRFNPNSSYPKMKLDEIRKFYKDPVEEKAYQDAKKKADELMNNFQYDEALKYYAKALEIRPRDAEVLKKVKQLNKFVEKQNERDDNYNKALENANRFFKQKSYQSALKLYQTASVIKPEEKYPKKQIEKINTVFLKEKRQKEQYQKLVDRGDSLYMGKNFKEAKLAYQEALEIIPTEKYPINMIAKIDPAMAEAASKAERYQQYIEQGDRALTAEKWLNAKKLYENAAKIYPEKTYPPKQIAIVEKKLVELEIDYKVNIAKADSLFENSQWKNAKTTYQKALAIKPNEVYPTTQIEKIDNRLAQSEAKRKEYETLIAQADAKFEAKDYETAKQTYESALQMFGDEKYPKEQLEKIEDIFEAQLAEKDRFEKLVKDADKAFNKKDYQDASETYKKALAIDNENEHVKVQLKKIDDIFAQQAAKRKEYEALIAQADAKFEAKDYETAKQTYESALQMFGDEKYPKEQLEKIEAIFEAQLAEKDRFEKLVKDADKAFKKEDYQDASETYKKALAIDSESEHVKAQLKKIDDIFAQQTAKRKEYEALIAQADTKFEAKDYETAKQTYKSALQMFGNEKYPKEQLEKIEAIFEAQLAEKDRFEKLVKDADKAFNKQNYQDASETYKKALAIDSESEHVKAQLKKIDDIFAQQAAKHKEYEALIVQADAKFEAKDYETAKQTYESALQMFENEEYPKEQLEKIEAIFEAQLAEKDQFEKLVKDADKAFKKEDYQDASETYKKALAIDSESEHVKAQLKKIDDIFAQQAAQRKEYEALIVQADAKFEAKDYETAKQTYESALQMFGNEEYPKEQLEKIEAIFEAQLAEKDRFEKLVKDADKAFNKQNYQDASETYKKALAIDSESEHVKVQLKKIDDIFAQQAAKRKEYEALIVQADAKFEAKDYETAKQTYESALQMFGDEKYPKEQLEKIEAVFEAQLAEKDRFEKLVKDADIKLNKKLYEEALALYEEALKIQPEDAHAKSQMEIANTEIAAIKAKKAEYDQLIEDGDQLFAKANFALSKDNYEKALKIYPEETYPKEKIKAIEEELKKLQSEQEQYDQQIAVADKLFAEKSFNQSIEAYQKALSIKSDEQYPEKQITLAEAEIEKLSAQFTSIVNEGKRYLNQEKYKEALGKFNMAKEIKPENEELLTLTKEAETKLEAIRQEMLRQYNAVIKDADAYKQKKIFNLAIEKYEEAQVINPEEPYPTKMIEQINTYLETHRLREVVAQEKVLIGGSENKLAFESLTFAQRTANFLILKIKNNGSNSAKLFINYGKGEQKNGGVVIVAQGNIEKQYIIDFSTHKGWKSTENNWINIYVQGKQDVTIEKLTISKAD